MKRASKFCFKEQNEKQRDFTFIKNEINIFLINPNTRKKHKKILVNFRCLYFIRGI